MTREADAAAFVEAMKGTTWTGQPGDYADGRTVWTPEPGAPLSSHLAFLGRVAEAVFPDEDIVFRCGWVHGVLENCIDGARWKYDPSHAAMLAATAARRAR